MNQFRREHCVHYSRKDGILVYRDALKEWLQHSPDTEQSKIV
jgi:hypothetical protein